MKLTKTLLSRPPNPWSYPLTGLILLSFLILSLLRWTGSPIGPWLTANREQVFQNHEVWRVFTAIAIHSDLKHYLSNALFFAIFGFFLHSYFGFFVFPVLALTVGALVHALTLYTYPAQSTLMGASGVVYFMAALWATLYVFIERKSHILKRILAVIGVCLSLFFPTSYEPEVSYLAHALGFAAGMVTGCFYFFFNRAKIRENEIWVQEIAFDEDSQFTSTSDAVSSSMGDDTHGRTIH